MAAYLGWRSTIKVLIMFFFLYRILLFFKQAAFLSPLFTLFSLLILDSELFCINLRWMKLWFCESFNIIIHKLYHTCQNFLHMFRFGFFCFCVNQMIYFLTVFMFYRFNGWKDVIYLTEMTNDFFLYKKSSKILRLKNVLFACFSVKGDYITSYK